MNWVDGVLVAVIAVSAILGFFRGLVREVLGVGAWIGALVAAFLARPHVLPFVAPYLDPPWLADAVGAGAVFLAVLLILKVIIHVIADQVQRSMLGGVDRALGLLFGVARGVFLILLAYIVGGMLVPATERWPQAVKEARALPLIADGSRRAVEYLPPDFRPRLAEPPVRTGLTLDDLLRPPARSRE